MSQTIGRTLTLEENVPEQFVDREVDVEIEVTVSVGSAPITRGHPDHWEPGESPEVQFAGWRLSDPEADADLSWECRRELARLVVWTMDDQDFQRQAVELAVDAGNPHI